MKRETQPHTHEHICSCPVESPSLHDALHWPLLGRLDSPATKNTEVRIVTSGSADLMHYQVPPRPVASGKTL